MKENKASVIKQENKRLDKTQNISEFKKDT